MVIANCGELKKPKEEQKKEEAPKKQEVKAAAPEHEKRSESGEKHRKRYRSSSSEGKASDKEEKHLKSKHIKKDKDIRRSRSRS